MGTDAYSGLLSEAESLLDGGDPRAAVILGNAALEQCCRSLLVTQLNLHGMPDDAVKVFLSYIRSFNPVGDDRFLKLLSALLFNDDRINIDKAVLDDLREARRIRNKIVHEGKGISAENATKMLLTLKRATEKLQAHVERDIDNHIGSLSYADDMADAYFGK